MRREILHNVHLIINYVKVSDARPSHTCIEQGIKEQQTMTRPRLKVKQIPMAVCIAVSAHPYILLHKLFVHCRRVLQH
jgi:hypothetical protein